MVQIYVQTDYKNSLRSKECLWLPIKPLKTAAINVWGSKHPANIGTRILLEYSNQIFVIILFKIYNRNYVE